MKKLFELTYDRFLTITEAAHALGIEEKTLRNLRCYGIGPPYYAFGRTQYLLSECLLFKLAHRVRSPTEARYVKRQLAELLQKTADLSDTSPAATMMKMLHSAAGGHPSSPVPRKRRLYHRITNREREILRQASASQQQAP